MGVAFRESNQFDEAESHYHEALELADELSEREDIAIYTGNLAELALDREVWTEAEDLARQGLALSETLGRQELIGCACYILAKALARQGRGAEGIEHAQRAVAILFALRHPDLPEAEEALAECRKQTSG